MYSTGAEREDKNVDMAAEQEPAHYAPSCRAKLCAKPELDVEWLPPQQGEHAVGQPTSRCADEEE